MTRSMDLLTGWVLRQSTPEARGWFSDAVARMPGAGERERVTMLAMATRRVGRDMLALDAADIAAAEQARSGWRPAGLSVVQAARLVLVSATYEGDGPAFATRLSSLCRAGDLHEVVGYYRGLPVFPEPFTLLAVARDGARSAMQPVFDAVALHSPYPSETFEESGWNQMVLKSLFIGSSLLDIQGLERRGNARLATTLVEYAHERWSARRPVSPELWRCVGPFATEFEVEALQRAAESEDATEREAAQAALRLVSEVRMSP